MGNTAHVEVLKDFLQWGKKFERGIFERVEKVELYMTNRTGPGMTGLSGWFKLRTMVSFDLVRKFLRA